MSQNSQSSYLRTALLGLIALVLSSPLARADGSGTCVEQWKVKSAKREKIAAIVLPVLVDLLTSLVPGSEPGKVVARSVAKNVVPKIAAIFMRRIKQAIDLVAQAEAYSKNPTQPPPQKLLVTARRLNLSPQALAQAIVQANQEGKVCSANLRNFRSIPPFESVPALPGKVPASGSDVVILDLDADQDPVS